jgi:hypothetical protein
MLDDVRRDADWFIAVGIVVGDDPDVSRLADAGVDGPPSRILHTESERGFLTSDHNGRDPRYAEHLRRIGHPDAEWAAL